MKYMHKLSDVPYNFEDYLLGRLFFAAELANMTIVERENYEKSMRTELDRIAELDFAREAGKAEARAEGLAQGKAEGLAQGKAEGLAQAAKAMLEEKLPPAVISKCTGIPEEKLKEL